MGGIRMMNRQIPTTEILDQMRLGTLRLLESSETVIHGHVVDYDPNTNSVRVELYPGSYDADPSGVLASAGIPTESEPLIPDWIPLATPWSGNGWGMQAGPDPSDQLTQVSVHIADNGDGVHSVFATYYHDQHQAPGAPAGELWMVQKTKDTLGNRGTYVKLTNDSYLLLGGHNKLFEKSPLIGLFGVQPDGSSKGTEEIELMAPQIIIQGSPGNGNPTKGNEEVEIIAPFVVISAQEVGGSNSGAERLFATAGKIELLTQGSSLSDLPSTYAIVRQSDLQIVVNFINNHVHSNAGGTGNSGPPVGSTTANASILSFTM